MSKYFSFYTSPPIWIDSYIDPYNERKKYISIIKSPIVEFENDKYCMKIYHEGLIALKIIDIEINDNEQINIKDSYQKYKTYCYYALLFQMLMKEILKQHNQEDNISVIDITYENYSVLDINETGEIIDKNYINPSYFGEIHNIRRLMQFSSPNPGEIPNGYLRNRNIIDKNLFKELNQKLFEISKNDFFDLYIQLIKSFIDYKNGYFSISLANSWFILESLINSKWEKFINSKNYTKKDGSKRINKDRLRNLTDGNSFTISSIINVLELFDVIEFKNYLEIEKLRKNRNKIVHRNEIIIDPNLCIICFNQIYNILTEESMPTFEFDTEIVVRKI